MVEKNKASDNFKHYVNALMTGNSYFSGELIYKYSLYVLGFIHVILSILMLICQSYKLMIANIAVCIVIYTVAPKFVKRDSFFPCCLAAFLKSSPWSLRRSLLSAGMLDFSAIFSLPSQVHFTFLL